MNTIIKIGLAGLFLGPFSALPSGADTPDATIAFTKHGLPVPGAYFKARENKLSVMKHRRLYYYSGKSKVERKHRMTRQTNPQQTK